MNPQIGITGTRDGMTAKQETSIRMIFSDFGTFYFHHGDCIGVDDQATTIAKSLGAWIVCHPPIDRALRAFNPRCDELRGPLTHFARNRVIVNESDQLIVVPRDGTWQPRGGTWYTHDYALKVRKPVIVIWPSGVIYRPNHWKK